MKIDIYIKLKRKKIQNITKIYIKLVYNLTHFTVLIQIFIYFFFILNNIKKMMNILQLNLIKFSISHFRLYNHFIILSIVLWNITNFLLNINTFSLNQLKDLKMIQNIIK